MLVRGVVFRWSARLVEVALAVVSFVSNAQKAPPGEPLPWSAATGDLALALMQNCSCKLQETRKGWCKMGERGG